MPSSFYIKLRMVAVLAWLLAGAVPGLAALHGQPLIDSLIGAFGNAREDSVKGMLLLKVGKEYNELGQFDTSRRFLERAMQLAKTANNKRLEAEVLNNTGISYYYQGRVNEALQTWEGALVSAQEARKDVLEKDIRLNMGNALTDLGNYPRAMEIFLELLKKAEAAKNEENAALCMANMAIVFAQQKKMDRSLEYDLNAVKLFEKTGNKIAMARTMNNIATSYSEMNQLDKARDFFTRCVTICEKHGFAPEMATAVSGLADVYQKEGKLTEALDGFRRSIEISKEVGNPDMVAVNLVNIGKIYLLATEKGHEDILGRLAGGSEHKALVEAHHKIDSAIGVFAEAGDVENLKTAYGELSEVERRQGNFKSALEHFIRFKDLSDTLFNQERDKKLTESAMQYEFDKKEAGRKAEQEIRDTLQKNIRNSISAGLVVALGFSIVVFRQRNKVKKEKENVEAEKARSEDLLLNILPAEVAEELKSKGAYEAKQMDDVTVLFTDFKDFTVLAQKMSPRELVEEVNICFSAFDDIISKRGIEKIKTIGDAYMAAGGLPAPSKTHAIDTVGAALDMEAFILERRKVREAENKPFFEIRIGVHSGPVIVGIVGVKKFQYDIWSDTVNTASRMETAGEVGRVNISGATYALVKDQFSCEYRGRIAVKGKGEVDMYFVS